jgi:hypothetical protein
VTACSGGAAAGFLPIAAVFIVDTLPCLVVKVRASFTTLSAALEKLDPRVKKFVLSVSECGEIAERQQFGRRAAGGEEGAVDQLDIDPAILYRLGDVGDLDEFARGGETGLRSKPRYRNSTRVPAQTSHVLKNAKPLPGLGPTGALEAGGWQEASVCTRCRAKDPFKIQVSTSGSGKLVV